MRTLSIMDIVGRWAWFRDGFTRRAVFIVILLLLALLTIFPRRYVANVKLASQQVNSAGLGTALSQFGGAGLLNGALPVELDVAIGRSFDVQRDVVQRLGMVDGDGQGAIDTAVRKLQRRMRVDAIRGNILNVEISDRDKATALRLISTYTLVMQRRLAALSRDQTSYKLRVLSGRLREAGDRLAKAEAAINAYRLNNRLIEPQQQFSSAAAQVTALQNQLQTKSIELQTAERFRGEQSYQVRALRTEIGAIRASIARAEAGGRTANGPTAAAIAPKSLEFDRLNRQLQFAQALFESYTRYSEGAALENLTADFNMQIIEGPYIEVGLKPNLLPLAALVLVALAFIWAEFYVLRPPPGARVALA